MTLAPIVLFVYNRPWHTQQTIEALQKNELASESELFIYCDAAKNESAAAHVAEVRTYVDTITGFKKISIIKRDKNWGLADSIIDGVTSVVNQYEKIIVMEDDLVTSPYFLKYMNEALEFYQSEDKVWHVSGYTPPLNENVIENNFFIYPTSCWGWATWKNRWSNFRRDTKLFLNEFDRHSINRFNINNSYNYYSHIQLNDTNKIKTWAIFWYATVFFGGGLSLHPKKSLVRNIGHDNSGVHCGENNFFDIILSEESVFNFSRQILVDLDYSLELERYYRSLNKNLFIRLINKIKKITRMNK